jgi:hypothetical protein
MKSEAFDIVKKLDDELEDYKEHEWFPIDLAYSSDGYNEVITFMGAMVWNSVNEERSIDDDIGDYESLELFVRRRINEALGIMRKIKIRKE